ncbi:ribosome recycling factor [Megalodesulfovibrio gigas]|uniref:Ribosome-recycling factor n=1 Tax=Megalodesulfovibrio gigas (strain ATCC 19364 / DSM 1382 / NCIMB 9332 / VKM B-1759) TaxID=1121448 RepID=T2GFX1_MEGG1|nr:ribosome recycling factor [Megalodesulfovibrio gigas]AGW15094.1 putative ribosome recycling factor [Megalodesulfovibrio gigas DSM 1382 = ATCC 19364]
MQNIIADAKDRMAKAVSNLEKEFSKLRTGRASTSLVEDLKVDYYGTPTPIAQVASVAVPDSRTITIQPWDRNAFSDIEKAIQKSDLGLNPVNDGKMLRIIIPPLTEERRKDLVKVAKKYTEEAKVAARNVRRDANDALKKLKDVSEDEVHKAQEQVQKLTDDTVAKLDQTLQKKDKEIMEL